MVRTRLVWCWCFSSLFVLCAWGVRCQKKDAGVIRHPPGPLPRGACCGSPAQPRLLRPACLRCRFAWRLATVGGAHLGTVLIVECEL